jgi:hypothetical protein
MKRAAVGKPSPIQALADVLGAVPDDAERDRILKNLDLLIAFFTELRRRVESLPSSSERVKTLTALEEVGQFLDRARDNDFLATALGLAYDRRKRRPSRATPGLSRSAQAFFEELKSLPTDEIQRRLNDYKQVTMNDLHGLASLLGLRFEERMKRQDLVDRIVKLGFANVRGYDLLRRAERSKGSGPS